MFFQTGWTLQSEKMRWLLALTLALALAAPGSALGEVAQRSVVANQDQGAPPPIQVIRRTSVGGAYPIDVVTRNKGPKKGAKKSKTGSKYIRSVPVRSTPVCSTPTRTTVTNSTAIRSIPLIFGAGRA